MSDYFKIYKELNKIDEANEVATRNHQVASYDQDEDISMQVMQKLFNISKALADRFGYDQETVLKDMISDLQIINGDKLISQLDDNNIIDKMTADLASNWFDIADDMNAEGIDFQVDQNQLLQSVLQMNERQCVDAFAQFLQNGGANQIGYNGGNQRRIGRGNSGLIESLVEAYILTESIDDIYNKYYSSIPREEFDVIITLDPTFNPDKDKIGTYGKWLLTKVTSISRMSEEEKEAIRSALDSFNNNKNRLPQDKRDINRIKSIEELKELVGGEVEAAANKTEIQIAAEKIKGLEFIAANSDWEIYSPHNFDASKWVRNHPNGDAVWCTGWENDRNYFDRYTSDGNLYVMINKANPDGSARPHNKFQMATNESDKRVAEVEDAENQGVYGVNGRNGGPAFKKLMLTYPSLFELVKSSKIAEEIPENVAEVDTLVEFRNGGEYVYKGGQVDDDYKTLLTYKNLKFEEGLTKISSNAFQNCTSLNAVEIPATVTSIGAGAFQGCTALAAVKLPATEVGSAAFSGCTHLVRLEMEPETKLHENTFQGCSALKSISIPVVNKVIPPYLCSGCTSLESLEIPEGVETISSSAFAGCSNLGDVIIPNSVSNINIRAFDIETAPNLYLVFYRGRGTLNVPEVQRPYYARKRKLINKE